MFRLAEETDLEAALAQSLDRLDDHLGFSVGRQLHDEDNVGGFQAVERRTVQAGRTERNEGTTGVPGVGAGIERVEQNPVEVALKTIFTIGQQA